MSAGQVIFLALCAITVVVHVVLLFYRGWIMDKLGNRQDAQEKELDKHHQRLTAIEKRMQEGGAIYFPHPLTKVQ